MRRTNLFFIPAFCILLQVCSIGCKRSGDAYSGPINNFKRYPYERFHLTYEYSGDVRGIEELFASEFGKYEARHSKIELFSTKGLHPSDNGSISRISDMYKVDYLLNSAVHTHINQMDSIFHLESGDIPSPQAYLESEMKKNYFVKKGIDSIFGKLADRWEESEGKMTLWIWNGLLLRRHANSSEGYLDMKIKEVDTLWSVDTSKFSIPSGFTVSESKNEHAPDTN